MFDAILFDFDGVLADTEPIHFACWREVLAGFGIDLASSRLREFVGVADRAMLEQTAARNGTHRFRLTNCGPPMP